MGLKDKFMIGGWQAPPPTIKNYRTLVKCGLNTIFLNGDYTTDDTLLKKGVKAAERTGVSVILEGKNNLNSPILFNNPFKNYNCIVGVNVYDEPTFSQLKDVAAVGDRVKAEYRDKAFYLNLLPSYSPPQAINSNFSRYIKEYAKIISEIDGGGWLSFDYYPLERTDDGKFQLGKTWLNDVETLSLTAKKYGLKPHFFIQSMAYGGAASRLHDRQPTIEDLRLQIYVYLSYGAKGFTHFCYQSPYTPEFNIDQTGLVIEDKRTDRWFLAKKVHNEISAFIDEYAEMQFTGCVKVVGKNGDKTAFDGLNKFKFSDSKFIRSAKSDGNALIGVFKDENGKEGLVVVNYADTSENISAKITLRFKTSAILSLYRKGKNKTKKVIKSTSFNLEKGEGVFITVENA